MKNQQTNNQDIQPIPIKTRSRARPPPQLTLKVQTWLKQSHGLFDYQSPEQKIQIEQFIIKQPSRIYRNANQRKTLIRSLKQKEKTGIDKIQLFNIQYNQIIRAYVVKNSLSTALQPLLNINGAQNQKQIQRSRLFTSLIKQGSGHQLKIGDFIKLGRVQLLVSQINNGKKSQALDYQEVYGNKQFIFHLKQQLQGCCKICLSQDATQDDPLLNPCLCKGSCGVIHLQCLRNWINNKVRKQIYGVVMTYNFDKFSCQICMAPFPSVIKLQNGVQTQLLKFQRPTGAYILMQQCFQSQAKSSRILHFLMPGQNGNSLRIGRAQICELMITDISVSRTHSSVQFIKNKFILKDQGSKFGTLVELKDQKMLKQPLRLQHNGCSMNIDFLKSQKKQKSSLSAKKTKSLNKNLSVRKDN